MIERVRDEVRRHIWCEHWRATMALVTLTSIGTAMAMRWLVGVYAVLLPTDSWASALAQPARGGDERST